MTTGSSSQESQSLEIREKVWKKKVSPLVKKDWVRDNLVRLDTHKSMGPNGMNP